MKTLDDQIEYIQEEISSYRGPAKAGNSEYIDMIETCEAILKTLEESREASDLALERAVQVCKDEMVDGSVSHEDQVYNLALTHAMDSILALKSKP